MISNFSNDCPVDSVETEKSRIVLRQLEEGWWVLASIDLTQLPSMRSQKAPAEASIEYSSREVAPAALLITHLVQAHSIFLLHHAGNLNDIHSRLRRPAFCAILDRYWTRFATSWDVMLHGHPAVDMFNATKLAGGGEIGVGVGEEEWGSGEREVLEDFVHRTEGLVDIIVARYGDAPGDAVNDSASGINEREAGRPEAWLGTGDNPRASDGVVFAGVGALSRGSTATISQWMESIFRYGDGAYGVAVNPHSRPRQDRKARRAGRLRQEGQNAGATSLYKKTRGSEEENVGAPRIPPPLVSSVERSLADATKTAQQGSSHAQAATVPQDSSYFDGDAVLKWMKLGYGSSWTLHPQGFSNSKESHDTEVTATKPDESSKPDESEGTLVMGTLEVVEPMAEASDEEQEPEKPFVQRLEQSIGRFLIGLSGDLENTEFELDAIIGAQDPNEGETDALRNTQRIVLRTLTVQLRHHRRALSPSTLRNSSETHDKLQIAIYIHQPFIFLFLFDLHTSSLSIPSFYRSIHHQLGPMQKALLRSTDPRRIPERVAEVVGEKAEQLGASGIYDLVYDCEKLTVRTSVPNIPIPGTLAAEGILGSTGTDRSQGGNGSRTVSGAWYTLGIPIGPATPGSRYRDADGAKLLKSEWNRVESLHVHTQMLNAFLVTRRRQAGANEIERTVKTSRGWWVVWMRVPMSMTMKTISQTASPSPSPLPSPYASHGGERRREVRAGRGEESEAFLVRKTVHTAKGNVSSSREKSGKWLLREDRDISGTSAGAEQAAATSARGVVEGVGVDARRWVEGLMKLSS